MATALRELVAIFGVKYDAKGAVRADRDLDRLGDTAKQTAAAMLRAGGAVIAQEFKVAQATDKAARKKEQAILRELRLKAKAASHANRLAQAELRDARASVRAQEQKARAAERAAASARRSAGTFSRVRDTLTGLGIFFGVRETFRGFGALVTAASDADETMNVLQESFKDSTQDVLNFSRTAAAEVGRSEFQLREFAGTIGAIVNPMLKGLGDQSHETAAKVSTDFAKLAVDLSSFFNTSEKDALIALRAGLVGESEPLRRFGVNIVEQNLADFAGVKPGDLQKMSQTEKTLLRYRFIMEQTAAAQGDAARTSEFFANASRALLGRIKEVAVLLGRKVLPAVTYVTRGMRDFVKSMGEVIKTSRIVEAVLITGVAAAAIFAARALQRAGLTAVLTWVKTAIPILLTGAALAAVALAVDDVLVAIEGGQSTFGEWLDGLTGVTNSAVLLKEALRDIKQAVAEIRNLKPGAAVAKIGNAILDGLGLNGSPLAHTAGRGIDAPLAANPFQISGRATRAVPDDFGPQANFVQTAAGTLPSTAFAGRSEDPILRASAVPQAPEGGGDPVLQNFQQQQRRAQLRAAIDSRRASLQANYPGLANSIVAAPRPPGSNVTNNRASTNNRYEFTVNVGAGADRGRARDVGREVQRGVRQALREERRAVTEGVGN